MRKNGGWCWRLTQLLMAAALLLASPAQPVQRGLAAPPPGSPEYQAADLLDRLTPEERIGQLFLVTFNGQAVDADSSIYNLIANHHVGGIVLSAENDNIIAENTTAGSSAADLNALISRLQQVEWGGAQEPRLDPTSAGMVQSAYIPLFIGAAQEGDGYPYDQMIAGVTSLPDEMAYGATWTPELVSEAGKILGAQLSALGINLLLGPSLDVLDPPQLETTGNLGTRTFGGDPYWVGKMGQAFIRGVHQGSNNTVAVAAKHFPGHGSSDRLPEQEVATVRKSLDELVSFDLAPFLAVSGNAPSPGETTDALMTSHIRYQGLQGNIRATTRPVSFDPQALSLLFELPGLSTWRTNGGVMVSDDLGNQAVRRFYDLTNQPFDARRVALNAFLAGNDLLYIANFSTTGEPNQAAEAIRTLEFFTQKYRDDAAFAARVNESVLRILTLKYRLYTDFSIGGVLADIARLPADEQTNRVVFSIAQEAATLLSPSQAELDNTIPDPPNLNDRIIFLTDTRTFQPCSTCPPQPELEQDALQNAVIRLYGPQAGGQVVINNLSSFSLEDLQKLLDRHPEQQALEQSLERANWIVFSMLSDRADVPSFTVLRRFLDERPDLLQQKRVIVFAFTAPYYLDATDISKVSAYYALYSKTGAFVDVAAYLLFGELRPSGASPVSVPGINYNLNQALFPDPTQSIPLFIDIAPTQVITTTTTTPEPAPAPEFQLGEVIPLRTGVILDQNRHPVPDGTPVSFYFTLAGEATSVRQTEFTREGIARTTFSVNTPGSLEIHAESENARSEILRFDILSPGAGTTTATAEASTPTPGPSLNAPTPVHVVTQAPVPQATPVVTVIEESALKLWDWFLAVFVATILGFGIYRLAALAGHIRWGVRAGLLALIGGLISYSYMAWAVARSRPTGSGSMEWGVFFSTLAGGLLGLAIAVAWRSISRRVNSPVQWGETPRYNPVSRLAKPPAGTAAEPAVAPAGSPPPESRTKNEGRSKSNNLTPRASKSPDGAASQETGASTGEEPASGDTAPPQSTHQGES